MRTIEADEHAVRATMTLVASVTSADLDRPTPCAAWNLAALLDHMTAQHRGFAAAARGNGADLSAWQLTGDPLPEYAGAAEQVIAAFATPGAAERGFVLPEIGGARPIPGVTAIGFHLVDYVVHGWDVARALGRPFPLPAQVLAAALPIARAVPGGERRLAPGAAFAPEVAAGPDPDPDPDPLSEILARLGRAPAWAAPENVGGSQ
jgi:uncharacterized protein (TIGR03086 family)